MKELKIFESHAHYDDEAFDEDREELLKSFPEKIRLTPTAAML